MRLRVIAAGLVAIAAAVVPAAGPAQAAITRPASCYGTIDIGSPGQLFYSGQYVGEVEQQYDSCSGTVIAHWQWAGSWQQNHPYSSVVVAVEGYNNGCGSEVGPYSDAYKNVNATIGVHDCSPDIWGAGASVTDPRYPECGAEGSFHDYSNGANVTAPVTDHC